jgi:hypothetical protein
MSGAFNEAMTAAKALASPETMVDAAADGRRHRKVLAARISNIAGVVRANADALRTHAAVAHDEFHSTVDDIDSAATELGLLMRVFAGGR